MPYTDADLTEFFTNYKAQLEAETKQFEETAPRHPLTMTVRVANAKTISAIEKMAEWQRDKATAMIALANTPAA